MKHTKAFLFTAGLFTVLYMLIGCSPIIVKTPQNYIKDSYTFTAVSLPEAPVTPFPAANVDYDNANRMVFFNFAAGKLQEVKNTIWDIAIVVGDGVDDTKDKDQKDKDQKDKDQKPNKAIYAITNSGDYGENTRILPLADGKNKHDYIGLDVNQVQQVCFQKGETDLSPFQNDPDSNMPVANPFYEALENEKKYFLRVGKIYEEAKLFIVWFDKMSSIAAGQNFTLHVIPVMLSAANKRSITGFGTEYTLNAAIDGDYSFNYIKLKDTEALILKNTDGIPKRHEWQLLFMRTNIYSKEMGEIFGTDGIIGTSSILTNSPAGVKTAALYGWDFPEVTAVPEGDHFVRVINGVGKGFANPLKDNPEKRRKSWYYGLNMPPTFYLSRNTYVFTWKDDKGVERYAKFRPGSFYGPQGQKFYVQFRYAVR